MIDKNKTSSSVCCDFPKCSARFSTYSDSSVAREQAAKEGWVRVSGKTVRDAKGVALSSRLVDLCPAHKPRHRMVGP